MEVNPSFSGTFSFLKIHPLVVVQIEFFGPRRALPETKILKFLVFPNIGR